MSEVRSAGPFLSLHDMHRRFGGVQALEGVSLDLSPGEVHCLAGENGSGKSTLIKLIAGVLRPHAGTIRVGERTLTHLTPPAAMGLGIQVIYQDLPLFPNLAVAENLALNTLLERRVWLARRGQMREIARRALADLEVTLDLERLVGDLPVAERQIVAIARALLRDARLVILDEPTTALTSSEVASLFALIRRLTRQGVAMLFVSHKVREMLQIADRFTVLRNGRVVDAGPADGFDAARVTAAMTGRELQTGRRIPRQAPPSTPLLLARGLRGAVLRDVSLQLHAGEILGVTGLLGAGQGELALMLAGAARPAAGRIEVAGTRRAIRSIRDAVRSGIAYVPEDRLLHGVFLDQSLVRNITAASLRRLRGRAGLLSRQAAARETTRWIDRLSIRAASAGAPVRTLSGGNQQRVVLAKWLATAPRLLVLNGPTAGVDVGAKAALHDTIRRLAADGLGVVMISDDVDELVAHCDRVLVLRRGAVAGELAGERLTETAVSAMLAGR